MTRTLAFVALTGATLGLAGCDSSSNPRDDLVEAVNSFGRVFAAGFFADIRTDVQVDPKPGDLRVDFTADPIDF